jgi:hypothetical protein
VHRLHRYLSHASHADVTGSKFSNDRGAQASQKKRHLPGACTFQMRSTPANEVLPKNSARYAELEENYPVDDHFQMNLSGWSDMWKFCRRSQRRRYWTTTSTVRAKVMSRIQRRPESASHTIRDFLILGGTALQRSGANWRIEHPLS